MKLLGVGSVACCLSPSVLPVDSVPCLQLILASDASALRPNAGNSGWVKGQEHRGCSKNLLEVYSRSIR